MSLDAFLGREPDFSNTWTDIVDGPGLHQPAADRHGLYALYDGPDLLYIGKSKKVTRRLGQLVGAICGGWYLHSGGWRFYRTKLATVDRRRLIIKAWYGTEVYSKEAEAIQSCDPSLNRTHRSPRQPDAPDVARLCRDLVSASDEKKRRSAASALLTAMVKGVTRKPYKTKPWAMNGWLGEGHKVGQRWTHTLYIGWKEEGGVRKYKFWAYVDGNEWFSDYDDSSPNSAEGVERQAQLWHELWYT